VLYFSYLGGSGDDEGLAIAADSAQGSHITGSTTSGDFPTLNPVQAGFGGATDAFVTRIDTTATTQTATSHNSSFLGGSGIDHGTSIAVDSAGATYVAGDTTSIDFPKANALQNALNGAGTSDAFVSKLGSAVNLQMTATATPNPVGVGSQVTFTFTVTNKGDFVPAITYVNNLPANGTFVSATASGGNCGSPAGTPPTVTCSLGALNAAATETVTVVLTPTSIQVPPGPPNSFSFGDSANLIAPGVASASANVTVNDFSLSLAPNSATVVAGGAATYTAAVTPTGTIPGSVSLSCTGLPTGASCTVANGAITNLTTGPQSRAMVLNTTARVTTTTELRKQGPLYAVWFPVSGLAFLGLGIGGTMSRRRRAFLGVLIGAFFLLIFLQPGCGSHSSTSTTTGTPAGAYTFTVTATSGSATHSQIAQLTVQ